MICGIVKSYARYLRLILFSGTLLLLGGRMPDAEEKASAEAQSATALAEECAVTDREEFVDLAASDPAWLLLVSSEPVL